MSKVTMQDIARNAGFSPTTVSMVLNGRAERYHISAEAVKKIEAVAKEMGYFRNAIARAMITGKSKVIAFITTEVSNEYTAKILEGIVQESHMNNYFIKIFLYGGTDKGDFTDALTKSLEYRCAGIFLHGLDDDMLAILAKTVKKTPLPIVNLDSSARPQDWTVTISSDDEAGCALAVDHLVELGHKNIGHLSIKSNNPYVTRRLDGYTQAMKAHRLKIRKNYIQLADDEFRAPSRNLDKYIPNFINQCSPRPTAITCSSDILAILAMREFLKHGLHTPKDISIIGFSNMIVASYSTPTLTTIAQDFKEIGKMAFRCIEAAINQTGKHEPGALLRLPVKLIARDSTAKPATDQTH